MALKNYTTKINTNKTIGEIQEILAKHRAKAILTEFDDEGEAMSLSFKIESIKGEIGIKLPANTEKVYQVLKKQKTKNNQICDTKEQAKRTAWRNLKDWIDVQMALLETEQVELEEIFLPYMINTSGQTLYQAFKNNQLMIGGIDYAN